MKPGMRRALMIFSVCLNIGFIVFTGIVYFLHPSPGRPAHVEKKLLSHFDSISMTEVERDRLIAMVQAHVEHMKALKTEKVRQHIQTIHLVQAEPRPVPRALDLQIRRVLETEEKEANEVIRYLSGVRDLLGPERAGEFYIQLERHIRERFLGP